MRIRLIILAGTVALMAVFFLTADTTKMIEAILGANYWLVALSVGIYLLCVWCRACRWSVMMRHVKAVSAWRMFQVVVVGYMANGLLPMRLGELAKVAYLSKRENLMVSSVLGYLVAERSLDGLTLLGFIIVTALFIPLDGPISWFVEYTGVPRFLIFAGLTAPFLFSFGTLLSIAFWPRVFAKAIGFCTRPLPRRLRDWIDRCYHNLSEALLFLRDSRRLPVVLLLSVAIWVLEISIYWAIGFSFGLDGHHDSSWHMLGTMVLVAVVTNMAGSIPATPGSLGIFQVTGREMLVLSPLAQSIGRAVAGAYTLVVHAVLVLPMIVLGAIILWTEGLDLRHSLLSRKSPPVHLTGTDDV